MGISKTKEREKAKDEKKKKEDYLTRTVDVL